MALVPFSVRLLGARIRAWLAHRRVIRRAVFAVVLLVAVGFVANARAAVSRVEAEWGVGVPVVVVQQAVMVGEPFAGQTAVESWPVSVVPVDAATPAELVDEVVGTRQLEPGDIVTRRDVQGLGGTQGLATNQRALSVPITATTPTLATGDGVELIVLMDQFSGLPSTGEASADEALPRSALSAGQVIEVGEDSVTVAVGEDDVAGLAQALRDLRLVIVRR